MGRSPKPLTLLALGDLTDWPEFIALKEQGHVIAGPQDLKINTIALDDVDVILGPTCWRMDAQHRKYLPQAIAAARKVRYPKEKA